MHTPGPWTKKGPAITDSAEDFAIIAGGEIIAEAFGRSSVSTFHDSRANADLIASAPILANEVEKLRAQVATLRETLEDARVELEAQATYFGPHLDPENNLFRILRKVETTLETTKEGA